MNNKRVLIYIITIAVSFVAGGIVMPIIVKGDNNIASTSQVLSGKTFSTAGAVKVAGTMQNFAGQIPEVTAIAADEAYVATIDLDDGYYESIKINAKPIYDAGVTSGTNSLTGGNATASDILSGKTAYVNGQLVTGNIVQRSAGGNITTYGYNSSQGKGYVYFNAGYYPVNNATYGTYVWLTKDQVKALANACGVGYDAGKAAGDVKHTVKMQIRPNANTWPCYFKLTVDGTTKTENHYDWKKGEDYYLSWTI